MTAPSPERRAELLQWAEDGMADAPRSYEVRYFLAKTEPVDDGEVGRVARELMTRAVGYPGLIPEAVSLLERLAHQASRYEKAWNAISEKYEVLLNQLGATDA